MTGGGLQVEYTTRLFLSYRDKTPLTTCIQNIQYTDELTLIAENQRGAAVYGRCIGQSPALDEG